MDKRPVTEVAKIIGANRLTLRRWIDAGRLKAKPGMVNRRPVVLVSVAAAKKIAAKGVSRGRPKKAAK
jgi:predicted site-specific integrase-resolvase